MASYYLRLFLVSRPILAPETNYGSTVVVRGKKPPVKEDIEKIVYSRLRGFDWSSYAPGPKDLISVLVEHGGYAKRTVLVKEDIPKELVFDTVWSAIEKHYLYELTKPPKATKKTAPPAQKKYSGRL